MATKKTPNPLDDDIFPAADAPDLDGAIDDLRGVLKADADGDLPAFGGFDGADAAGGDFGMDDFPAAGGGAGGGFASSFPAADSVPGSGLSENLDLIMDIPIDVQIVLGTSRMLVSGLMGLEEGATIALDRKIGEPVEIMVNNRCIARGEITVLEDDDTRFGVKLIEVMSTRKA